MEEVKVTIKQNMTIFWVWIWIMFVVFSDEDVWESRQAMLNKYGDVCCETYRWTMTSLFCVLSGLPLFPAAAPTETSNSSISLLSFEGIHPTIFI